MSAIHTITSREFGHNVSRAKHLARQGPVFITDHGEPAFVLLTMDVGQFLAGNERTVSLLERMDGLPNSSEVANFEIDPIGVVLRLDA